MLTVDQINNIHQIPLEEVVEYLNHEISVNMGVQNNRVSHIKVGFCRRISAYSVFSFITSWLTCRSLTIVYFGMYRRHG